MPKHRAQDFTHSISTYGRYLTIAFQIDVENLLLEFEKCSSLKFSDFASVWREMKFSYINSEQQYFTFIQMFADNCFFIIKKFIVYRKSLYTEVGALYLLYSLYFKQIIKDWVKIRITHYEFLKLQDLIERLRQDQHLEPLFCYAKLVTAGAFEFVFNKKPLAPEPRYMKNFSEYCDDTFKVGATVNSKLRLKEKLEEDNFLERLSNVTSDYNDALAKFSANNPGLGIFESTIVQDIHKTIQSFEKSTSHEDSMKRKESIYERRMAIKDRAMAKKGSARFCVRKEELDSLDEEEY